MKIKDVADLLVSRGELDAYDKAELDEMCEMLITLGGKMEVDSDNTDSKVKQFLLSIIRNDFILTLRSLEEYIKERFMN